MFQSPGDIAVTIGDVDIYWYGIFMSLAILSGFWVVCIVAKKFFKEISVDLIVDLSFVLIIFGLIFARLYYVVLDYRYFLKYPSEIIAVWHGGISIQGAIIGGLIAGLLYVREFKLNFLRLADLFSFGLITGQIVGRWGNFFNSEAFGLPTQLPWKLYIPFSSRPLEYKAYDFFHPTFLYESVLNVLVLLIMFLLLSMVKNRKDGLIFFSYIILYSIVRIFVETIRIDSILNINGIHIAHIVSIFFIFMGILGLLYIKKHRKN